MVATSSLPYWLKSGKYFVFVILDYQTKAVSNIRGECVVLLYYKEAIANLKIYQKFLISQTIPWGRVFY